MSSRLAGSPSAHVIREDSNARENEIVEAHQEFNLHANLGLKALPRFVLIKVRSQGLLHANHNCFGGPLRPCQRHPDYQVFMNSAGDFLLSTDVYSGKALCVSANDSKDCGKDIECNPALRGLWSRRILNRSATTDAGYFFKLHARKLLAKQ
jgi:hypothetical protein